MKRLLSVFLAVLMILSSVTVFAETDATVTGSTVTGGASTEVSGGISSGGGGGGGGGSGSSSSQKVVYDKLSSSEKVKVGEITVTEGENKLSAYTYLKSVAVISEEVTVIGAMYKGDILVATDIRKAELIAGINSRVDFEFPMAEYDRIEAFVFNNLSKLMPYSSIEKEEENEILPFGVLYALYEEVDGVDSEPKAAIYTSDGMFTTYSFAKNIVTNSDAGEGNIIISSENISGDFAALGGVDQRLVYFELDDEGKICKFLYDWGFSEEGYYLSRGHMFYNGLENRLGNEDISDAEFVTLSEPAYQTNHDKYSFGKMNGNGFIHGKGYNAEIITDEATGKAVFGIVFDYSPYLSGGSDIMYVTSVSDVSDDDGNILRLFSGYVNNEKASFAVDMNEDVYVYDKNETLTWDIFGIRAGNVIQYNLAGDAPVIKVLLSEQDVFSIASDNMAGNLLGTGSLDSFRGFMQAGRLSEYYSEDGTAVFTDGTVLELEKDAPVMLLRADSGCINKVFAGPEFNMEMAETDMYFTWDENDDKVWVYEFGGRTLAAVIIDTHYDNEFEKTPSFSMKSFSFGTVSPYSDLKVTDTSFEEFYTLNKLGYMGGFSDGTVRPEAEITGVEFVALLIKTMGLGKISEILWGEDTPYEDVPGSHWASGFVNLALNRGIIKAEDGFSPLEPVTYENAVVFTVRALGYSSVCNTNIKAFMKASDLGIIGGISQTTKENATRRTIAELLYNSLNVPLMEIEGFAGEDVNYVVPDAYETLLSTADIARLEGYVESVSFDEEGKVVFNITRVASQYDEMSFNSKEPIFESGSSCYMNYAESMDIIQYLPVVAYVDVSDPDEPVMLSMSSKGSADTLTLKRKQMIGGWYVEGGYLGYYKNGSEADSEATEVRISDAARIYINNGAMSIPPARFRADYSSGLYPEVMLIDSDASMAGYDIILAKEYRSGVISKIDYKTGRITLSDEAGAASKDVYFEGCVSIKDKSGKAIKLSEVKTGNVINVFESCDEDGNLFIDIIVTDNIVEGTVDSYNGGGYYTINGEEYYFDLDFEVGEKGFFYVDMYGKVVGYSVDEPVIGEGGEENEEKPEEEEKEAVSLITSPFSDLKGTESYFNAFYTLNLLNILKGYEDGTAKPESSITRAEFIAVLVRALGYEEIAESFMDYNTCFEDVTGEHWASGYVNVALNCGILEEGKAFRPDEVVSYGDAVKFTVGALGYTPLCEVEGDGSEYSYLYVASKLGLITDEAVRYSEESTRRIVAELIYNALEVDMMEQVSFGSNPEYAIPYSAETMLSKSKIARIEGYVREVSFSPDKKMLSFDIMRISKQYDGDRNYESNEVLYYGYNDFAYAEDVQINKFVTSRAYVNMKDANNPVIMGMCPVASAKTLTLTSEQMRNGYADVAAGFLEYYETSAEADSKTTYVKLSSGCEIFSNMNSMPLGMDQFRNSYISGRYPEITLIDTEPYMSGYDVIVVKEYYSAVVEDVYEDDDFKVVFSDMYNTTRHSIWFGDDGDYSFNITDENGNKMEPSDIRRGDVLTVFESEDYDAYIFMDIIVSRNTFEGRVYTFTDNGNAVIGGNEYSCSPDVILNIADTGKFYTDIYGNIIRFEKDINLEYGVLETVYSDAAGPDIYVNAVIFGKDNCAKVYAFADKVKVASPDFATGERTVYEHEIASDFCVVGGGSPKPVAFGLNAQGEINRLYYGNEIKYVFENLKFLAREGRYYASEEAISGVKITDDTLIINVSESGYPEEFNKEAVTLMAKSELADRDYLGYEMFVNMTTGEEIAELLVICNIERAEDEETGGSGSPPEYDTMYVTGVGAAMDANNVEYKIINGSYNGENVTLYAYYNGVEMYDVYGDVGNSVDMIGVGSVIQYIADENGFATAIRILLAPHHIEQIESGNYNIRISNDEDDYSVGYIYSGRLAEIGRNSAVFDDGNEVYISDSLCSMLIRNNSAFATDKLYPSVAETNEYTMGDMANGDYVWVYKFDSEALAFVIFDTDADDVW